MNLLGTHDTMRILTALTSQFDGSRAENAAHTLSHHQYAEGVQLLRAASLLQYTLPGSPSIYYGDEAGMEGYKDPFNRGYFPWGKENSELVEFYRALGKIRKECSQFVSSPCRFISAVMGCVAYSRDEITVISNSNNHAIRYYLPEDRHGSYVIFGDGECDGISVSIGANSSVILKR
jgi:glycosidase